MKDKELGYYYDWSVEPCFTTDPKCVGGLERGKHQRVFLNGEDMGNVRKCQVGGKEVGWVEKNVLDESGSFVLREDDGKIDTERFFGKVEYICDD